MNLLYDYQVFSHNRYGGTSRYFIELISQVVKNKKINVNAFFGFYHNKYNNNVIKNESKSFVGKHIDIQGIGFLLRFINKYYFENYFKKVKFTGIYHPTYYELPKNISSNLKVVITIHDMIPEKLNNFDYNDKSFINKKNAAERANAIIAVSKNTKKDIIDIFKITPEKISVIPHGCSILDVEEKNIQFSINKPYVLFVGGRQTYKNFNIMLKSFLVSKISNSFSLICVGGGKFSDKEKKMIKNANRVNDIIQINANDGELKNIYKKASLLIVPSLYEGFGLPVLEGLALGCPVIASNSSSIPEVLGDAGIYFDPNSSSSIIQSIENVLTNDSLRMDMIQKGIKRSKLFTWNNCAMKTISLYESLLK